MEVWRKTCPYGNQHGFQRLSLNYEFAMIQKGTHADRLLVLCNRVNGIRNQYKVPPFGYFALLIPDPVLFA